MLKAKNWPGATDEAVLTIIADVYKVSQSTPCFFNTSVFALRCSYVQPWGLEYFIRLNLTYRLSTLIHPLLIYVIINIIAALIAETDVGEQLS